MKFGLQILAVPFILFSCSHPEATSPKARTLAAWKAMQKIGYDNSGHLPKAKLDDPSTFRPGIKHFRNLAFAYSQIDLDGVDEILTNYLRGLIKGCKHAADVLESQYDDVLEEMKSRDSNAANWRKGGELLADQEHEKDAGDFVELLFRLSSDSDFQDKLQQIHENHQSDMEAVKKELQQVVQDRENVAQTLTQKYNVPFITDL